MRHLRATAIYVVPMLCLTAIAGGAVSIETVPVGNAGNGPDPLTGYGQVNYNYRIGKYEVTAAQYTAFLNAVGGVDTFELYDIGMSWTDFGSGITRSGSGTVGSPYSYSAGSGFVNRPITFVTFARACRFANWLQNGQPNGAEGPGTTETGTYTITEDGLNNNTITRNGGSTWSIANEAEWYKAAYHKNDGVTNHYYLYPTSSDIAPGRDINDVSGNNANYAVGSGPFPIDGSHYHTIVGEFENSASPYGTFDQAGNLEEFTDTISGQYEVFRGGNFDDTSNSYLRSTSRNFIQFGSPTAGSYFDGFRVVNLPEPGTCMVLGAGLSMVMRRRERRS